jgi:hypothetical protein
VIDKKPWLNKRETTQTQCGVPMDMEKFLGGNFLLNQQLSSHLLSLPRGIGLVGLGKEEMGGEWVTFVGSRLN